MVVDGLFFRGEKMVLLISIATETDYVHGFGNASGEYWLGLSKLHQLANGSVSTQLRVDLRDHNGVQVYAKYSTFHIGGSTTDYTLHASGYSGTAGDSFVGHSLLKFSTKDKDSDFLVLIVPFYCLVHGGTTVVTIQM